MLVLLYSLLVQSYPGYEPGDLVRDVLVIYYHTMSTLVIYYHTISILVIYYPSVVYITNIIHRGSSKNQLVS